MQSTKSSNQFDFDKSTLEDLMKEANTFVYEVEYMQTVASQLEYAEWKHKFNEIFSHSSKKIDSIQYLIDLKSEGEKKPQTDPEDIVRINELIDKIEMFKVEIDELMTYPIVEGDDKYANERTFKTRTEISTLKQLD
jgi:hypothetical protein